MTVLNVCHTEVGECFGVLANLPPGVKSQSRLNPSDTT